MERFALASVYPRSIAWIIRLDEWDRFEKIVKYNCAMVGGYFNIFIPLTEQNTISEKYQHFLIDYDPDLIILPPDMKPDDLVGLSSRLHPFAIIPWEVLPQVAMLDAAGGLSGVNATLGSRVSFLQGEQTSKIPYVAVADTAYPDTSRLALVACGEVEPCEPMLNKMDDDVSLDATGHREMFLERVLKSGYDRKCFRMQHHNNVYPSFIGLTAFYKSSGTPQRKHRRNDTPAIVILVSTHFHIVEATLFWNLRASGFFVSWLPFEEIEKSSDALIKWLDSDYGGVFYSLMGGISDIVFSSPANDLARLEVVFGDLLRRRQEAMPNWRIEPYDGITFYDYQKPHIKQERVWVAEDHGRYTFIPKHATHSIGIYTVLLEWDGLMLPQSRTIVSDLISSDTVKGFLPAFRNGRRVVEEPIRLPKFRITSEHFLKAQISSDEPITFDKPSPEKVTETLFTIAGHSHTELSSTARYHNIFLERIGSIDNVQQYLAASPYRELLELLSNNTDRGKDGWILDKPSERRVLNHLHLCEILAKAVPPETKKYMNSVADFLPEEALHLLDRGILERGFKLRCSTCSYHAWYPADHVGQTFECARCFKTQVYRSNPLWLYKLPEVLFQGFAHNMHVPLLTLYYLKRKSQQCFEWIPDSDVFWVAGSEEKHRNVDILCLSDGRLYLGEAKSIDEIDREQFSFYEDICKRVPVDGIVFATSKFQWNRATLQRIEQLKATFSEEIIVLTRHDLYNEAPK
jgi:hypothetical protein